MPNDFYASSGTPSQGSFGSSAAIRAEFNAILSAFDKLPALAASAGRAVFVNAGGTALESSDAIVLDPVGGIAFNVPVTLASGPAGVLTATTGVVSNLFSAASSAAQNVNAVLARGASDGGFQLRARNGSGGLLPGTVQADLMMAYTGVTDTATGFRFYRGGGATDQYLGIWTGNQERFVLDANGRFAGLALHNNPQLPTGTALQYVASGTYSPVLTAVQSVASLSATSAQWLRVGNVVTASGSFSLAFSSTADPAILRMSIPIPSAFALASNAGGAAPEAGSVFSPWSVLAVPGTALVELRTEAIGPSGGSTWSFTFTYVIL